MTAETLRIGRFDARYRLAGAGSGARDRLDTVLADMLERTDGPATDDIVCLRSVSVPVRLRLDSTDAALATVWGDALALAVARAMAVGGRDVVRYRSRAEALVDVALGVSRGDAGRAWAWRQLELWGLPDDAGDARRAEALARVLAREPESVVAVLASVARQGVLPRLLASLTARDVESLADAALAAAGAPRLAELARPHGDAAAPDAALALERAAERTLRTSAIAVAAQGALHAVLDPEIRRALAALAVLEADPGLGWAAGRSAGSAAEPVAGGASGSEPETFAASLVAAVTRLLRPALERPDGAARRRARERAREREARAAGATVEELGRDEASAVVADGELALDGTSATELVDAEPGNLRARAWTEAGGLIHLVHVVDRLGLPRRLQEDPALAARPLRWSLHRIGSLLTGAPGDDPAVLAFAGLPPESTPPSEDERPAEETETAALEAAAERIGEAARVALERTDDPAEDVVRWIVERRAELVADPGWIEVRMRLDAVSTELRRAGLDLDPGWVPWLGVVLRFGYA